MADASAVVERFWGKVDRTGSCWLWTAYVHPSGYGTFHNPWTGKKCFAHRFAYELVRGTIPDHLVLDHLCRNPVCVNPDHLEAVTQQVNVMRGISLAAGHLVATHCARGHEFTEANTYLRPTGGRACRACRKQASIRHRSRVRTSA